ncbi:MAG: hypothetical protein E7162_01755 [Firmicutes bacterium]|nr:hypothetical protein [Bacillota bacterium]
MKLLKYTLILFVLTLLVSTVKTFAAYRPSDGIWRFAGVTVEDYFGYYSSSQVTKQQSNVKQKFHLTDCKDIDTWVNRNLKVAIHTDETGQTTAYKEFSNGDTKTYSDDSFTLMVNRDFNTRMKVANPLARAVYINAEWYVN